MTSLFAPAFNFAALPSLSGERKIGTDLAIALISLPLLFVASPLFAASMPNTTAQATTPMNPAGSVPLQPQTTTAPTTSVNVNPYTLTPGSSQSARSANLQLQNGSSQTPQNNPQLQQLPPCTVGDSACIEQQNRNNQLNPQTAPTFVR